MTKQKLWQQTKKVSFWLTYTALMMIFSFLLFYILQEQYYILTDYSYWRYNFTVFAPFNTPQPPVLKEYIDVLLCLLFILPPYVYNYYLLFKRKNKKKGLFVLIGALILLIIYGFFKCDYITYCG